MPPPGVLAKPNPTAVVDPAALSAILSKLDRMSVVLSAQSAEIKGLKLELNQAKKESEVSGAKAREEERERAKKLHQQVGRGGGF